jgi:hypothetical protein
MFKKVFERTFANGVDYLIAYIIKINKILLFIFKLLIYIIKMESGFTMFIHSVIITAILYAIMKFILKQSEMVAQDRSILIGALSLVYMILFGHGLPTHVNKNIM